MYLDLDLDQLITSLTARSNMMAFVLDGRQDPLAEIFGLVHREDVLPEKVDRFRALLKEMDESNAEVHAVRGRLAGQLPHARSGSETLQLRQAYALVDRLYRGNIRLAQMITTFLAS